MSHIKRSKNYMSYGAASVIAALIFWLSINLFFKLGFNFPDKIIFPGIAISYILSPYLLMLYRIKTQDKGADEFLLAFAAMYLQVFMFLYGFFLYVVEKIRLAGKSD